MAIKLIANYSKRPGPPGYSSHLLLEAAWLPVRPAERRVA